MNNFKEVIFTDFCDVQYLCITISRFNIFHEFRLYHEILPLKISRYTV